MDRKTIIRQLVEKIEINIEGETEWVEARIHWAGGHETYTRFRRPVARVDQLSNWKSLQNRIRELLAKKCSTAEIVNTINREGYRSPSGNEFTKGSLNTVMLRYDLRSNDKQHAKTTSAKSTWTTSELARELQVGYATVYQWITKGKVQADKIGGRWIINANESERAKLIGFQSHQRERKQHHQHTSNSLGR